MKLSEIGRTLREIRVSPVKTLGQNFLHDQNLARWIVQQAGISAADFVLEIGPGLGALTEPLLDTGARVLAIEKDGRLADFLRTRLANRRLEIIHGDALEFEVRRLFPAGSDQIVRQSALLCIDATPASVSPSTDAYHISGVNVTEGSRRSSLGQASLQRLRNSYSDRPVSVPRRIFAHCSSERFFSAT